MSISEVEKLSESKIIEQILEDYKENKIEDYKEALTKINKCIEVLQESEGFRVRGLIYLKLKEKNQAFEDFNLAIQIDPKNRKAYNSRGCWYMNQKLDEQAIEDFGIAIGLNPLFWKPYNNRGNTYQHMKQYEKAIMDYNKAIELNPEYVHAFNNRGKTQQHIKQFEKAIIDYNKAIELNPKYAFAFINRGSIYDELKQYEMAIMDYNKAIELTPENADAFNNRGITYYNMKQYEMAIKDYNKAIELNSEYANAYNNRGLTYDKMKQFDLAIIDYNKAIELNPEYVSWLNNRGNTYKNMKQYQKTMEDFQNALKINQNHPLYNTNIGVLYSLLNDNQNCQKHLQLAQSILNTQNEMTLPIEYQISSDNIVYIKQQIKLLLQVDSIASQITQKYKELERRNTITQQDKEEFLQIEQCKVEVMQRQNSTENINQRGQDVDELKKLVQQLIIVNQKLEVRVQNLESNPQLLLQQGIQNIQNNKNYSVYYQSFGSRIINYFESCCMMQTNLFTKNNEAAIDSKTEDLVNKFNNAAQVFVGILPFVGDTLEYAFKSIDIGVQYYQSHKLENALKNIQSVLMTTTISAEDRAIEVKSGIINIIQQQGFFDQIKQELKDSKFSFKVHKIVKDEKSRQPEAESLYWQIGIQHSLIVIKYIDQFSSQLIKDKTRIRDIIKIAIDKRKEIQQVEQKQKASSAYDKGEKDKCCIQ